MKQTIREFKTYKELQAVHRKEVDEFPFIFVFAFTEQDFITKMSLKIKERKPKVNIRTMKGIAKYVRDFGNIGGCYVFKEDYKAANDMFILHDEEIKKFSEDEEKLSSMILSEMYNHEYGYTRDPYDTLLVLNKTENDLETDEKFYRAWSKAEQKCFASDCF